jgi:hypothetical protein
MPQEKGQKMAPGWNKPTKGMHANQTRKWQLIFFTFQKRFWKKINYFLFFSLL